MQANGNQTERGRLGEYIAVEFEVFPETYSAESQWREWCFLLGLGTLNREAEECDTDADFEKLMQKLNRGIIEHIKRKVEEDKEFEIIDAVWLPIKKEDIRTVFNDFVRESHYTSGNSYTMMGRYDKEKETLRFITFFPTELLGPAELPEYLFDCSGYFNRKVLRCISDETREKTPALKTIREIAEAISNNTGPKVSARPQEQTPGDDESNTDEPGAAAVVYPPGLEVIKKDKGGALDADFINVVLSYVEYIHITETDKPDRWEPTKTKAHRNRDLPWTVFVWKGDTYRAWKQTGPKTVYAVKLEEPKQGAKNRIFDFKNES